MPTDLVARVLNLALKTKPCGHAKFGQAPCHILDCTGEVALFPMLQRKCLGAIQSYKDAILKVIEDGEWHEAAWHPTKPRARCSCEGCGWVPVVTLEALLEAAFSVGWSVDIRQVLPGTYRAWLHNDERVGEGAIGTGQSKEEALVAALEVATEVQDAT